jgi:hypothetical protein
MEDFPFTQILAQSLGIIYFLLGLLSGFLGTLLISFVNHRLRRTEIKLKAFEELRIQALIEREGGAQSALRYKEEKEPFLKKIALSEKLLWRGLAIIVFIGIPFLIYMWLFPNKASWVSYLLAMVVLLSCLISLFGLLWRAYLFIKEFWPYTDY